MINAYLTNTIVGCVLVAVATTLLILLVRKGYRKSTLWEYRLVYGLLANMAFAWSFEIYRGNNSDSNEGFVMNAIYLLPVGSLLFALWYFEGVRGILKIKYCAKSMESLRWFTYFTILFTYCGFAILCILNPARTNSYDPGFLDYQVVIPVCVLGELAVVFLAFSIFKINRFIRELS
jgi:hypothetical protein